MHPINQEGATWLWHVDAGSLALWQIASFDRLSSNTACNLWTAVGPAPRLTNGHSTSLASWESRLWGRACRNSQDPSLPQQLALNCLGARHLTPY